MARHAYKAPWGSSEKPTVYAYWGRRKERIFFQNPKPPVDNLTQLFLQYRTENEPFSLAERSERVENFLFRATREYMYTEAGIEQTTVAMRCHGANSPEPRRRAVPGSDTSALRAAHQQLYNRTSLTSWAHRGSLSMRRELVLSSLLPVASNYCPKTELSTGSARMPRFPGKAKMVAQHKIFFDYLNWPQQVPATRNTGVPLLLLSVSPRLLCLVSSLRVYVAILLARQLQ